MANLEEKREGINIILERSNKNIKKDKVSAMGYALWWIKVEVDDRDMMRKTIGLDSMLKTLGKQ